MEKANKAQCELMAALMEALAKYEIQMRSERIKQGIARSKGQLRVGSKISNGLLHRSELRATI